ncbi:MAG: activase, partial [Rhodospirillales bacterium]
MIIIGVDVGSTTVKAVAIRDDQVVWRDYQRHFAKPAEQVLDFLDRMQAEIGLLPERDRVCFTGSGAGLIAPRVGGKEIQEVVAVAAAVEKRHPDVHFVSEIGGEDMKAIFFKSAAGGRAKQVYMQTACSGGTGTFIEKTARKLRIPAEVLSELPLAGVTLHKISAKCGIFAETDANSLLKGGVPVGEIIASLFDAVVHQNLAALTKGNTPLPQVLLLGGPNRFFRGLQEAWRHHLGRIWAERGVDLRDARPADRIQVPDDGLYYAALGCVAIGSREPERLGRFSGREELAGWVRDGRQSDKAAQGRSGLVQSAAEADAFRAAFAGGLARHRPAFKRGTRSNGPLFVGCDFGSTTAKAAVLSPEKDLVHSTYVQSHGNPIEDAKALFRAIAAGGVDRIAGLALTGYGKDLLVGILGADLGVVETVAHAKSAQDVFPNADVICDVGGTDVKIMILRQGTVADFRLNSQCSSGNGAFLQGVAERYGIPLEAYAERAFAARAMPSLMMGCGVFLQSDIIRQQRHGWSP